MSKIEETKIYDAPPAAKFVLLLAGSIRAQQVNERGREIVLYCVAAGESCVLTTACLTGHGH